jgi:hypothetical protein
LRCVIGLGWSSAISIMDCELRCNKSMESLLMRGEVIHILCLPFWIQRRGSYYLRVLR